MGRSLIIANGWFLSWFPSHISSSTLTRARPLRPQFLVRRGLWQPSRRRRPGASYVVELLACLMRLPNAISKFRLNPTLSSCLVAFLLDCPFYINFPHDVVISNSECGSWMQWQDDNWIRLIWYIALVTALHSMGLAVNGPLSSSHILSDPVRTHPFSSHYPSLNPHAFPISPRIQT